MNAPGVSGFLRWFFCPRLQFGIAVGAAFSAALCFIVPLSVAYFIHPGIVRELPLLELRVPQPEGWVASYEPRTVVLRHTEDAVSSVRIERLGRIAQPVSSRDGLYRLSPETFDVTAQSLVFVRTDYGWMLAQESHGNTGSVTIARVKALLLLSNTVLRVDGSYTVGGPPGSGVSNRNYEFGLIVHNIRLAR